MKIHLLVLLLCAIPGFGLAQASPPEAGQLSTKSSQAISRAEEAQAVGGWVKSEANPVLGGQYGTCFDVSVLQEGAVYRMWVSWRPKGSIALVESTNGVQWSAPVTVLAPNPATDWEQDINRPVVVKRGDLYHMWYSAFNTKGAAIGYATSADGKNWKRMSPKPVLSPTQPWEQSCVMCPHVLWDAQTAQYKMWYSAGQRNEPNAIGYATSPDGYTWSKHAANPIFVPDPTHEWEKHKVTACQVLPLNGWFVMFYIGFRDEPSAQIGLARSRDGITGWQRHWANPILRPGRGQWDQDACYKPFALFDGRQWCLWYNGRRDRLEQIGLALHAGEDLGFDAAPAPEQSGPLSPASFKHYIDAFNATDRELYPEYIPNAAAWEFLSRNIPLLDCPDKELEEIYYFRWWTFRKHIKQTPEGFVLTEFLPKVNWAGKENTICCAAGHHFREGRWLGEPRFLDDYARFWFRQGGSPRSYSFWAADSLWARSLVTGDLRLPMDLLPDLIKNYEAWETTHRDTNGLYWQVDDRDGMEVSIGGALHPRGQGYRVTLNSYQYGDALAIAQLADAAGQQAVAERFRQKAAELKRLVEAKLWDPAAEFFKVLPRREQASLADVRELHGFTPWYFNLPGADKAGAWRQLMDPQGFYAPFGPTTAEQRHPQFALSYRGHECQWNGPSWPFSTAITLTALANLLNGPPQEVIGPKDYFNLLKIYARSQHLKLEDGRVVPWIDENLNPTNGDWLSRTRLKDWEGHGWSAGKGGEERGKDYNHSTFCDLVISGLVGLRPRADQIVEVNPLVPGETWDYFCLERVPYHHRFITILWDKTGQHYHRGQGLRVLADGQLIATAPVLQRVTGSLP